MAKESQIRQCSACRHWRESTDAQKKPLGDCHLEPPTPLFCGMLGLRYVRPLTAPDDGCGRFQRDDTK